MTQPEGYVNERRVLVVCRRTVRVLQSLVDQTIVLLQLVLSPIRLAETRIGQGELGVLAQRSMEMLNCLIDTRDPVVALQTSPSLQIVCVRLVRWRRVAFQ